MGRTEVDLRCDLRSYSGSDRYRCTDIDSTGEAAAGQNCADPQSGLLDVSDPARSDIGLDRFEDIPAGRSQVRRRWRIHLRGSSGQSGWNFGTESEASVFAGVWILLSQR